MRELCRITTVGQQNGNDDYLNHTKELSKHRGVPQPGDLDPSFGTGGKVTTDFGGTSDFIQAIVLQSDGKIVAAGYIYTGGFALARYNADGGLDTTFGTGGRVTTDFGGSVSYAYALVLQPDGKILAAGITYAGTCFSCFALARYNADGSLDTSFGTGGKVTTNTGGGIVQALVLQPDGKILAVGFTALARYNADGSLDTSFGTGGKVTTSFGGDNDLTYALVLQPDGKIVTAGITNTGTVYDFALARYNADGSLDMSFGTGGKVTTDFGGSESAQALALQSDGKIVAAGTAPFALARYNADGSLDTSFGTGGKVITDFSLGGQAYSVVLQLDGKIVAAGLGSTGTPYPNFALARYNADGSLDMSFGTGGKVTTDFGTYAEAFALVLQPDGKIVAGGDAYTPTAYDFALVRYLGEPAVDLSITKTDSPDPVTVGSNLTYNITITNNGPSMALLPTMDDLLPAGVTFVSVTFTQGNCYFVSEFSNVHCDLGGLTSGGTATVTIVVTPMVIGTISNTASSGSSFFDPNMGNNSATVTTTVTQPGVSADLSVSKADSPDPVQRNANLTYTLTVTNNGPSAATAATLTDTLPSGVTILSITPSQGSCSSAGLVVTCPLGSLNSGANATVTIVVTPNSTGTLTNTASVTGSPSDPNLTNNSATTTTTVANAVADLAITKTVSPDPVTVNTSMSYTMVVTNNGPSRATGVTLTDPLPAGATFVSAASSRGSCSEAAGTVTCTIGRLGNGRSATVTIIVTPTAVGTPSNTACVTGNEPDPNPFNDCATAPTTVNPPAINTPAGSGVSVPLGSGLTVTFGTVSTAGETTLTVVTSGPAPPTSFRLGTLPVYYDLNTTATFSGPITICFAYDDTQFRRENALQLFHYSGSTWTNVTTTLDTTGNVICGTTTSLSPFVVAEPDVADLLNISSRARVLTADNVLIGGFIINGSVPKTVLLRARGPSMGAAPFNIPGVLANPTMQLYSGSTVIAQNDNWQTTDPLCTLPAEDCGDTAQISATAMDPCQPNPGQSVAPPNCALEAALLVTLPPGGYTTIVRGVGGTGVGLVEVFEADTLTTSILINISSRARVETADNVLIGGLIIGGTTPKTVLLRARGPSMGGAPFDIPGVLANPIMQLYSGSTVIAQNDNWQTTDPLCLSPATACGTDAQITATAMDPCQPNPGQTVAPPNCGQESALLVTLPPGGYTAIVRGVGGGTGVGLVEVFEVP